MRNQKIHQQGYFIENKLDKDNSFEIVDFKFNINYQEREIKLQKKVANRKLIIMNFSDAENAESPRYNMDSSQLFVSVSDN